MRVNNNDLNELVEKINKVLNVNTYLIRSGYGKVGLSKRVDPDTHAETDVTGLMTKRELNDWMEAFLQGIEVAQAK